MTTIEMKVQEAIKRAEQHLTGDYRIHAGVERKVVAKDWNDKRIYINIYCYSLAGNYKGKYDCGYIDKATGEYVTTQYTDLDLYED